MDLSEKCSICLTLFIDLNNLIIPECLHLICKMCYDKLPKECGMCRSKLNIIQKETNIGKMIVAQLKIKIIECDNSLSGCDYTGKFDDVVLHHDKCLFTKNKCINGCGLDVLNKDFDEHNKVCIYQSIKCENCSLNYKRTDELIHKWKKCTEFSVLCCECKIEYKLIDYEKHFDECEEKYILCEWQKCNTFIKKKDMDIHKKLHETLVEDQKKQPVYAKGTRLDVLDTTVNEWEPAQIIEKRDNLIYVAYLHWMGRYTDILDLNKDQEKILPYRSITQYGVNVGDEVIINDTYYQVQKISRGQVFLTDKHSKRWFSNIKSHYIKKDFMNKLSKGEICLVVEPNMTYFNAKYICCEDNIHYFKKISKASDFYKNDKEFLIPSNELNKCIHLIGSFPKKKN